MDSRGLSVAARSETHGHKRVPDPTLEGLNQPRPAFTIPLMFDLAGRPDAWISRGGAGGSQRGVVGCRADPPPLPWPAAAASPAQPRMGAFGSERSERIIKRA